MPNDCLGLERDLVNATVKKDKRITGSNVNYLQLSGLSARSRGAATEAVKYSMYRPWAPKEVLIFCVFIHVCISVRA